MKRDIWTRLLQKSVGIKPARNLFCAYQQTLISSVFYQWKLALPICWTSITSILCPKNDYVESMRIAINWGNPWFAWICAWLSRSWRACFSKKTGSARITFAAIDVDANVVPAVYQYDTLIVQPLFVNENWHGCCFDIEKKHSVRTGCLLWVNTGRYKLGKPLICTEKPTDSWARQNLTPSSPQTPLLIL